MNFWYGVHFAFIVLGIIGAFSKSDPVDRVVTTIGLIIGVGVLAMAGAYDPVFGGM